MVSNFPYSLSYAIGGLNYANNAIICGGINPQCVTEQICTAFVNGTWTLSPLALSIPGNKGSFAFHPNNTGYGRIIFAGGNDSVVRN